MPSMDISTRIDGLDELFRVLGQLSGEELRQAQRQGLYAGAFVVETEAKVNAPVDTGFLRNSITVDDVTDTEAVIAPHTEYAIYPEFGTIHMAARPYLRPALLEHQDEVREAIRAVLADFLRSRGAAV